MTLMLTPGDVIFGSIVILGILSVCAIFFMAWVIDTYNDLMRWARAKARWDKLNRDSK